VIFPGVLVVLGVAGCVWVLTGQGLDRAEKWVSLVGMFISVGVGLAGAVLGWVTWRRSVIQARSATAASGEGSVAIADFNSGKISSQSSGPSDGRWTGAGVEPAGGVTASGPSAVAIGGANTGDITTRFEAAPREKKAAPREKKAAPGEKKAASSEESEEKAAPRRGKVE